MFIEIIQEGFSDAEGIECYEAGSRNKAKQSNQINIFHHTVC